MDSYNQPIFSHVEPILPVKDITETINYWQETLGFPTKWTLGEPPTIGAVSWQKAHIQFVKDDELAENSKGNSIWIRLQRIEWLYDFHQQKNAEIVAPLENKPWGMAQYAVCDINGYYVHFAGFLVNKEMSAASLPPTARVIARKPTIKEYQELAMAVGWIKEEDNDTAELRLAPVVFAAVAEDTASGKVIGCGLLLGDQTSFYYVKDIMVHPDWQRMRVGTAIMQQLNDWLDEHGANGALVGLFSSEALEPFYQQLGFSQTFAMLRFIDRDKKDV